MLKLAVGSTLIIAAFLCSPALAQCTIYPHNLTNGSTADATQVMDNFNCAAKTGGSTLDSTTLTGITTFSGTATFAGSVGGTGMTNYLASPPAIGGTTPAAVSATTLSSTGNISIVQTSGDPSLSIYKGDGGVSDLYMGLANTGIGGSSRLAIWANSSPGWGGSVERLVVMNAGNVGINTSSPSYTLHVNGSVAGTSAYNNISDARLKKNVRPIKNALGIISRLQGVRFDWRPISERTIGRRENLPVGTPQVGFIAQQLHEILPEAVSIADDREHTMSVAESKVVPVLVEAIKQLKKLNELQTVKIIQLETRAEVNAYLMTQLKKDIVKLEKGQSEKTLAAN